MKLSYSKTGMEQFKRYIKMSNPYNFSSNKSEIRMVNQREMFEFILRNQGVTEGEIQMQVYSYSRSAYENGTFISSNKKYADCLRRLLDSGKVFREEYKKGRYVYFTSSKFPEWGGTQISEEVVGLGGGISMTKPDFEKAVDLIVDKGMNLEMLKVKFSWMKVDEKYKFTVTKQDVAGMMGINIDDLQILV